MGASNDGTRFYYSNAFDTIAMRTISSGVIAGADSQSLAGHGVTSYYTGNFVMAASGQYLVAAASSDPSPGIFGINTGTGSISSIGGQGVSTGVGMVFALPALGSDYYFAGYSTGADIFTVSSSFAYSRTAVSTATDFRVSAPHLTRPWVFVGATSSIDRYTVTASSLTFSESTATTGTTLAIAISSSGKRLFRLTSTELSMYSISDTGSLTRISQATIANGSRLYLLPYH